MVIPDAIKRRSYHGHVVTVAEPGLSSDRAKLGGIIAIWVHMIVRTVS
jgi:hypothetical protein